MSKIVRKETMSHNAVSIYHIALTLVGYMSFYNALVALNKISKEKNNRKNRNLQKFLQFANTSVFKDFSIALNELYEFIETIMPGVLKQHNKTEPRFDEFLRFIKKTKNNMKFHPSETKMNKILVTQKDQYPNMWGIKNKDVIYYCGYFMGRNVVFGSNLYYEYVFYEPTTKVCKKEEDLLLFTSSIQTHMETIYRMFEEYLFANDLDIPEIKLKKQKRFFQIYPETTTSEKIFKKSTYDKVTTFMLLLILEEIAGMQVYYDYYFDIEESTKSSLLLFFFTYILAIKYDEIRDCLEILINNKENKYDERLKTDFVKMNVLKKEVTDFAYKLRNSYHHTEVGKYTVAKDGSTEKINIKMEDLYLKLTESHKWPDDYIKMLNAMKEELNIISDFCRKHIGIKYG